MARNKDIKTKTVMVKYIADKTNVSQKDVKAVFEAMLDFLAESLKANCPVQLLGFGSFIPRQRASRECLVPMTGEKYMVQEKKMIKFKANKSLLDKIQ